MCHLVAFWVPWHTSRRSQTPTPPHRTKAVPDHVVNRSSQPRPKNMNTPSPPSSPREGMKKKKLLSSSPWRNEPMDQGHVPSQDWFPAKAGQIRRSRTRGLTRRLFTGIKEGKERERHFIVRCWPAGRISWLDPSPSKRFFTYCKPSSLQERSKAWFFLLSLHHRAGAGRAVFFSNIGNWAAAKK